MNDEGRWIALAREGDLDARRWLYDRYRIEVVRLCFRICRDETSAEDIAHEVFIRVFRKIHTYRKKAAFSTWLYRVTVNEALKHVASSRRRETAQLPEGLASTGDGIAPEIRLDLERAIAGLPKRMRAVLILHVYAGHSHEEVGEILGIAEGTSKAHFHRAKYQLKKELYDAV